MQIDSRIVDHLNNLLDIASNDFGLYGITKQLKSIESLEKAFAPFAASCLTLEEEVKTNLAQFLVDDTSGLTNNINTLQEDYSQVKHRIKQAVDKNEFELAGRLRSEITVIFNQMSQVVIHAHRFQEGFNLFNGHLIVVTSKDVNKEMVIYNLLNPNANPS